MDELERLAGWRLADGDVTFRRIGRRSCDRHRGFEREPSVIGLGINGHGGARRFDAGLIQIFVERLEGVDQRIEGAIPFAGAFQVDDGALGSITSSPKASPGCSGEGALRPDGACCARAEGASKANIIASKSGATRRRHGIMVLRRCAANPVIRGISGMLSQATGQSAFIRHINRAERGQRPRGGRMSRQ